jgi:large subunit ribosomal protein L5
MKAKTKVTETKSKSPGKENPMRAIKIEKIVLSSGATAEALVKAKKLLEILSSSKAQVIASRKRIPDFDVRPGLEVGARVTLRGKKAIELLKRLLGAIDNKLKKKQVAENHFSFGIEEYIEIPGIEYQRDIGIRGLNTDVVFARAGLRVQRKKIKGSKVPKRQRISQDEIVNYMEKEFKTQIE